MHKHPFYLAAASMAAILAGAAAAQPPLPPSAVTWISGEEIPVTVPADPSASLFELEYSKTGAAWTSTRTRLPAMVSDARHKFRPAAELAGEYRFRLKDPQTGKVKRYFRATILPPAGSPSTGPVLNPSPVWDRGLMAANASKGERAARYRGFLQAVSRLSTAKGADRCLPAFQDLADLAQDTLEALRLTKNAMPILIGRVHYHYLRKNDEGVTRGEYHRAALLRDTTEVNVVTFLARRDFYYSNSGDPVTGISVRHGGKTFQLEPDGEAEIHLNGDGSQKLEIAVTYASGLVRRQSAELFVRAKLSDALIKRRKEESTKQYQYVSRPAPIRTER